MDINNNLQINTFTKGMDTDSSDMYVGEGSYRYAENLRVVTDEDSNSGELHIIEGTNKLFSIALSKNELLLGYTSIRNYIITIVKDNENKWAIFKYNADNNFRKPDGGLNKELVAGWFEDKPIWPTKEEEVDGETVVVDDWDGKTKPLSLVTRWEAEDNVKLYIANGKTELLSINVATTNQGNNFDTVFGVEKITLYPIKARVTEQKGASIPGVVILYAYIVYKINGVGTTLSGLSNSVVETIDEVKGYKSEINGENTIELSIPSFLVDKYIRVFRVAYSKAGQLPRVDIIYDQLCKSTTLYDSGQSLQNVSSAEFIATNKLQIVPKEIESKGDYLFAGNVKYVQDQIDAKFDNFDARCFSRGNYYIENDLIKYILNDGEVSDLNLLELRNKDITLLHELFPEGNADLAYDSSYWSTNAAGYNGKGLCFLWRYVYTTNKLYFENQYNNVITPRTYARNEVYRFGVRLFDEEGNASSVKWIADIKMPDASTIPYTTQSDDSATGPLARNISIEFVPRNTSEEYWQGISRYEIVLAKRSINDSYKIAQGIVGFPMDAHNSELCLPYFLTTQYSKIHQLGISYGDDNTNITCIDKTYTQDRSVILFASPEYTYLPDDILALLDGNNNLYCLLVETYVRSAYLDTQNGDAVTYETEDPYSHSTKTKLNTSGQELKYKFINDNGNHCIFLDWDFMVRYNQGGDRNVGPIGPVGRGAKKNVYFTNVCAEERFGSMDNTKHRIESITYVDAQKADQFANNELPTYKNNFKVVSNGKKFFNWTNPAMFNCYNFFRGEDGGGDTATNASWKLTTMTAYEDNAYILWKTDSPNNGAIGLSALERTRNAVLGSSALSFPMSPGGPMIILSVGSNIWNDQGPSLVPPSITIANICRSTSPYGGYNISSINNTQYVSGGYSNDKETPTIVSMGDNYITMFVYFPYHSFDNAVHDSVTTGAIQYIVPIESTIDLSKQCSNYLPATSKDPRMSIGKSTDGSNLGIWVQAKAGSVPKRFILDTDMYMYNTAYSIIPDIITYSGQDTINRKSELYDSRIHYSLKKQNNELIDNWTSFKVIDYLDVDSRYGLITGLKLFKDKLIFLQESGAGVLSVNDRIILKDQESANIIVGNGGVLDRYDYFTTIYGMKPDQHAIEASNDALYWWDGYRKEIIGYTDGYNVNLLQRIKNVANYINKGTESYTPSIIYDANNKEVLFNVVNDKCIVYNEQIQQFTSVYTFNPVYYSNINGSIYLTDLWDDEEHLYEHNKYNSNNEDGPMLFEEEHYPTLKYIVNKEPTYNKVFDIQTFGGRFYKGNTDYINLNYYTPSKQHSSATGSKNGITNIEYDYRLAIPRNNNDAYGGRMRGKTIECVLTSSSNNKDFSIQYITTKYRMSWT